MLLLRVQMRVELAKLHDQLNATMIYVTHDQTEAMTLADDIVVLDEGSCIPNRVTDGTLQQTFKSICRWIYRITKNEFYSF